MCETKVNSLNFGLIPLYYITNTIQILLRSRFLVRFLAFKAIKKFLLTKYLQKNLSSQISSIRETLKDIKVHQTNGLYNSLNIFMKTICKRGKVLRVC